MILCVPNGVRVVCSDEGEAPPKGGNAVLLLLLPLSCVALSWLQRPSRRVRGSSKTFQSRSEWCNQTARCSSPTMALQSAEDDRHASRREDASELSKSQVIAPDATPKACTTARTQFSSTVLQRHHAAVPVAVTLHPWNGSAQVEHSSSLCRGSQIPVAGAQWIALLHSHCAHVKPDIFCAAGP
jgi:hypothetical protein